MFDFKNVYINNWFSIIGPLEANSNNLKNVDLVMNDYYYGEKTIEKAEIKMQDIIINYLCIRTTFFFFYPIFINR